MHHFSILMVLVGYVHVIWCNTCIAPQYIRNDKVRFTPNNVYVGTGDQAIVQCVVEYATQEEPPQAYMYINDCKVSGFDQPAWIASIVESDDPCTHREGSPLCHKVTMYISGMKEVHGSRVYCCARLGSRVCSQNSTISLIDAVHPAALDSRVLDSNGLIHPTKVATGAAETSCSPQPSNTAADHRTLVEATVFPDPMLGALENNSGTRNVIHSLMSLLLAMSFFFVNF